MTKFFGRGKPGKDSLGYASGLSPNVNPPSKSRRVNPALGLAFGVAFIAVGFVVADNIYKKSVHSSSSANGSGRQNDQAAAADAADGANSSGVLAGLRADAKLQTAAKPAAYSQAVADRPQHDGLRDKADKMNGDSGSDNPVSSIVQQAWVQYVADNIQQVSAYTDMQRQALSSGMSFSDVSAGGASGLIGGALSGSSGTAGSPAASNVTPAVSVPGLSGGGALSGVGASAGQEAGSQTSGQSEKSAYLGDLKTNSDYSPNVREAPVSNSVLRAGTVIPAVMESGINSDLPGQIVALVSANVYNSSDGNLVLIPQGAKLIGTYDNQVATGQSRVLVVWTRIIYPDGSSLDIGAQPGASADGYAGFHDQVNNHYARIFGDAVLLSVFSAGVQLSQPQASPSSVYSSQQVVAGALGQQLGQTGETLISRDAAIAPTLTIRPGYQFDVMITQDFDIKPWESVNSLRQAADTEGGDPSSAPAWVPEPAQNNGLPLVTYGQSAQSSAPDAGPQARSSPSIDPPPATSPRSLMAVTSAPTVVSSPASQQTVVTPPAVQGPTTPAPEPTWTLVQGSLLGNDLQEWGQRAGWTVLWQAKTDWTVPATTVFTGSFASVAGSIIKTLQSEGVNIDFTPYSNNVFRVFEPGSQYDQEAPNAQ